MLACCMFTPSAAVLMAADMLGAVSGGIDRAWEMPGNPDTGMAMEVVKEGCDSMGCVSDMAWGSVT